MIRASILGSSFRFAPSILSARIQINAIRGKKSKAVPKMPKKQGTFEHDLAAPADGGEFSPETLEQHMKESMASALTKLKIDLSSPSSEAGRLLASSSGAGPQGSARILDQVKVQGGSIHDYAQISSRDAGVLTVSLFDAQHVPSVQKAIASAGLGLNPQADAQGRPMLRVPIPKPTAEARQKALSSLTSTAEKSRIAIRAVRQQAMKALRGSKNYTLSSDEEKRLEKRAQALTDAHIKQVDDIIEKTRQRLQ